MLASCCVARKIFLSAANASSRARTLDSRPTTNGVIMNGKMTTSRMGIIGRLRVSNFSLVWVTDSPCSSLSRFFQVCDGDVSVVHHLLCDFEFLHTLLARQMVHQVKHQFFKNH